MSKSESHGVDDYLQAMYELQEEGQRVVQAAVAKRLGVSRASVSEQVARLAKMRLVVTNAREIAMSAHGAAVAEDAVRRHRLAERYLTDVLKMPWHLAHEEANRFQTGLTDEIAARMLAMLDGAGTCPHGNPIPGTGAQLPAGLVPLHDCAPGDAATLVRLQEDAEFDTGAMRYFEEHGLVPGAQLRIVDRAPDGTMRVAIGKREATVTKRLTGNVFVRAGDSGAQATGGKATA
jgi:DtxR family Mn-dependent transcriptional regulator